MYTPKYSQVDIQENLTAFEEFLTSYIPTLVTHYQAPRPKRPHEALESEMAVIQSFMHTVYIY